MCDGRGERGEQSLSQSLRTARPTRRPGPAFAEWGVGQPIACLLPAAAGRREHALVLTWCRLKLNHHARRLPQPLARLPARGPGRPAGEEGLC
eukprot:9266479-Alexandrium_andersonii.AAC.1